MRITVVGIGYVGLATAALWAAQHDVCVLDIVPDKVDAVNQGRCPFADGALQDRLTTLRLEGRPLRAALNRPGAMVGSEIVFIATPTNYEEGLRRFDIRSIQDTMAGIMRDCPEATVVIRSTMQPGMSNDIMAAFGTTRLLYCPEFLREGTSLEDCLRPSRLVVGANDAGLSTWYCKQLEQLYAGQNESVPPIIECTTMEAEAAKLFANTYLAARVAFFNELDSYALDQGLDASRIIAAISADTRIGNYYNNPSFGYGGYCLPKDSKALLHSMEDTPHELIAATVASNDSRKRFLAERVMATAPACVGVHRLVAKYGSDNLRSSAMAGVVEALVELGANVLVYEPMLHSRSYHGADVTDDLNKLLETCDVIIANRHSEELEGFGGTVFTRDLYTRD